MFFYINKRPALAPVGFSLGGCLLLADMGALGSQKSPGRSEGRANNYYQNNNVRAKGPNKAPRHATSSLTYEN